MINIHSIIYIVVFLQPVRLIQRSESGYMSFPSPLNTHAIPSPPLTAVTTPPDSITYTVSHTCIIMCMHVHVTIDLYGSPLCPHTHPSPTLYMYIILYETVILYIQPLACMASITCCWSTCVYGYLSNKSIYC